jgi:hypothetical protein
VELIGKETRFSKLDLGWMVAGSSSWFYNPYLKDLLERFVLAKKVKFRISPRMLWEELPPGFRGVGITE